ncbi:FtsX-like permease family protein [Enterococcus massiliensis]|uniref:FtsX-like permease family protein n=1 Tax=Enterococcus massiliensis TaxID=1640685 RepID=UPI00065E1DAF|nr:FtsX-like permease family protein [Enterococcus massiliensis]
MKKSALLKTSLREIKNSPARFFSILGIIFLGVAFFSGIGATGPDMIQSAEDYYQKQRLADGSVASTLGVTQKDLDLIKADPQVKKAVPQYMLDLNLTKANQVVRLFGLSDTLNDYLLTKGRLPEKSGEIALDAITDLQGEYKIGDTFEIAKEDDPQNQVTTHKLKVVGFVRSPEFIENVKRGNTNVGTGSVDYFGVVSEKDLALDVYSRILVTFNSTKDETAYTKSYEEKVDRALEKLETTLDDRPEERLAEVKETAAAELDKVKKQITDGEQALDAAEEKLVQAKKELDQGKQTLAENEALLANETAQAEQTLDTNEKELLEKEAELNQQAQQIASQKEQLTAAEEKLAEGQAQTAEAEKQQQALQKTISETTTGVTQYETLLNQLQQAVTLSKEELAATIDAQQANWLSVLRSIKSDAAVIAQAAALTPETDAAQFQEFVAAVNGEKQKITAQLSTLQAEAAKIEHALQEATTAAQTLQQQKQQIQQAEAQIQAGRNQIDAGKTAIAAGRQELAEQKAAGEAELAEADEKLTEAETQYQDGLAEFQKQTSEKMPKLQDAKLQLKNETARLDKLEPAEYLFSDREDNPGYTEYKQNADRISSLATVFPIIFFLIAALVSLTTMTRMIEEKRSEIGTFKALGYKNHEIALKFLFYSLSAGLIGSVLGLALGFYLFPSIIISAYGQLYNIEKFVTPWYLNYSLIGIGVGLVCTVGVALLTLRIDLLSAPASLLRPKAPKAGKRVWLEAIRPLWRRLSFTQKVTMRNLFRYKLRMLMTIFGIAGCTSMILTGFGLRDSISDIVPIQFEKIWHYQGIVTFNENVTPTQREKYEKTVVTLPDFDDRLPISSEVLTLSGEGQTPQDVTVYVPKNPDSVTDFILFNDRKTNKNLSLTDDGAIINEKLANLFNLQVGDTIDLKSTDHTYSMKVAAIAENYTGHFAYVTPTYYQKIFEEAPTYNTEFLTFSTTVSTKQEEKIAETLMENDGIINVSFLSDSSHALDDTTETLNIVVWVLIISAGLLAFIVLYNLNNINISERIRELSTIKVLGFYDKEVTMYIYRENIILTILGILAGLFLGKIEHDYVLKTVELDMLMFPPTIHSISYLYSSLITIFFTVVVGIVIYFKLKKVDMIEALKSNE